MYDCAIIGAGVVGLSVAYELAQYGLQVCLIDRGQPGHEASWAGAGILAAADVETAATPYEQLGRLSSQLHATWSVQLREETGIDNGYRRCGGIHVARSDADRVALDDLIQYCQSCGIRYESLSPSALVESVPSLTGPLGRGEIQAACYLPDEAQLRNPRHLQALIVACQARGVDISTGVEVVGFETASRRVTTGHTSAGPVHAEQWCIATGAWTRSLLESLGRSPILKPIRGQMVLFHATEQLFIPIISEAARYLVPRDDGRILAGSTEEDVGFVKENTAEGVADLVAFAIGLVESLETVPIEKTWSGLRPGTADRLPYLGRMGDWDNVSVAAGHFRSGLWLSSGTAVVVGQLIRGEAPSIDLTEFSVDRS